MVICLSHIKHCVLVIHLNQCMAISASIVWYGESSFTELDGGMPLSHAPDVNFFQNFYSKIICWYYSIL